VVDAARRQALRERFPLGAAVDPQELESDPYPVFERLREREPITWLDALGMWYVLGHEDCRRMLLDDSNFTTVSGQSLILETFGEQMLSSEGETHLRYRAALRPGFSPARLREFAESRVRGLVDELLDGIMSGRCCEFRSEFAGRLPVLVMLELFGLPRSDEAALRQWYDAFEAALANFAADPAVRGKAARAVQEFHALLGRRMEEPGPGAAGLIAELHGVSDRERLDDGEILRNLSIVFFGGISTVEALLLNTVHALDAHPLQRSLLESDHSLIGAAVEESMRWMAPVQSATRHLTRDLSWNGIGFRAGETVNCMLAAANRDPQVFPDPEMFSLQRRNLGQHLGFARGPHHCIGLHLARMEAAITLEGLLQRLPGWHIDPRRRCAPRGYEFRQPPYLYLQWRAA